MCCLNEKQISEGDQPCSNWKVSHPFERNEQLQMLDPERVAGKLDHQIL